jgi:uncharacterized protein YmfQ (DUF2313 family)
VERADGICNATLRSLRLLAPPPPNGSPAVRLQSLAAYLKRALPLVSQEAQKLDSLRKPQQTRALTRRLNRYLSALTSDVDELGALAAAARAGNAAQVTADERSLAAAPLPALAAASGLSACSNVRASYT